MGAAVISVAIREFLKLVLEYLSKAILKQKKINQVEAAIDEVKKAETEQDFKNSAGSVSDINRIL